VKPTRSVNTTDTTRRSRRPTTTAAPSGEAHAPQNRNPSGFSVPHCAHTTMHAIIRPNESATNPRESDGRQPVQCTRHPSSTGSTPWQTIETAVEWEGVLGPRGGWCCGVGASEAAQQVGLRLRPLRRRGGRADRRARTLGLLAAGWFAGGAGSPRGQLALRRQRPHVRIVPGAWLNQSGFGSPKCRRVHDSNVRNVFERLGYV
jgi:hypothetical protein